MAAKKRDSIPAWLIAAHWGIAAASSLLTTVAVLFAGTLPVQRSFDSISLTRLLLAAMPLAATGGAVLFMARALAKGAHEDPVARMILAGTSRTLLVPRLAWALAVMGLIALCLPAYHFGDFVAYYAGIRPLIVWVGSIGLLLGARLDFGQFGLAVIADWCGTQQPFSFAAVVNKVTLAPWTSVGMLIGCNVGMALSTRVPEQPVETRSALLLRYVACSAGMILGMLLAEPLLRGSGEDIAGGPASIRMFVTMILGMTAGMWGGLWLAEWALDQRARWAVHAASRHASPLRN